MGVAICAAGETAHIGDGLSPWYSEWSLLEYTNCSCRGERAVCVCVYVCVCYTDKVSVIFLTK